MSSRANPNEVVIVQKQRANLYSVLLTISLLALIIACVVLYKEMQNYNMMYKVPPSETVSSVPPIPLTSTVREAPPVA